MLGKFYPNSIIQDKIVPKHYWLPVRLCHETYRCDRTREIIQQKLELFTKDLIVVIEAPFTELCENGNFRQFTALKFGQDNFSKIIYCALIRKQT